MMINTIIYIYGSGVNLDIESLQIQLEERYCLTNITDEGDEKITFEGEEVSELLLSRNLDYIKIDAESGIFESLVFDFSLLLKDADPKHVFSFGFSGDPNDYKEIPVFKSEKECVAFLRNDEDVVDNLSS